MKMIIKFGVVCGLLLINTFFSCKSNKVSYIMLSTLSHSKYGLIIDELYENKMIYLRYPDENDIIYEVKLHDTIVDKINFMISKIKFNGLRDKYVSNRQDVNIYNVQLSFKDTTRTIYYYSKDAPKPLHNLVKYLISLNELPRNKVNKKINFKTRQEVPISRLPIPPMPDPNDTIIDLDNIEKDFILNKHYNEKDTLLPKHELIHKKK